jgi:hypothetical protein
MDFDAHSRAAPERAEIALWCTMALLAAAGGMGLLVIALEFLLH